MCRQDGSRRQLLGAIALLGFLALGPAAQAAATAPAPVAGLPDLAEFRGKLVYVDFWASWCVPCREEAAALEEFQGRHGGPDFTVLGIDTRDLSGDGIAFVKEFGLTYPQLRDGDDSMGDDFGTTGVPETYLIDPRGKVRLVAKGPVSAEYLRDEVEPLLAGAK